MKRRLLLAAAVVAVVLGAGALLALQTHVRNEITVTNHSGVPLESLEVTLPSQTLQFGGLEAGASRTVAFTIEHDAGFEISGRLKDGTLVRASDGYITNGQYGVTVLAEIKPGGLVKFTQNAGAT